MQGMAEDIRINEVQQVKDATYIPVVLADGSLGKIAKVDLAELIKPLIGFDTVLQDRGEAKDDFNTYKNTGYYDINKELYNNPNFPPGMNYGGLVVISCNKNRWILQLAYSIQDNKVRTRSCNESGIWIEWKED
jgi:hypothetical protein